MCHAIQCISILQYYNFSIQRDFFHFFFISLLHNIVELLHMEFDLLETVVDTNSYDKGMDA